MQQNQIKKYFKLSNWAVDNKLTVWVIIFGLLGLGIFTYVNMPKEDFPEIITSTIYVSTVYPGNAAEDIEKLVTKPLEDELKNISGVGEISSESLQDYSIITVEWDDDNILADDAKLKVKDVIDEVKAQSDWPTLDTGGPVEPNAFDLNFSESVPIININLTGDTYTTQQLKSFAKYLQDKIESKSEIKEASILGVDDKEVEIAIDLYKMNASNISMNQVIGAIQGENRTISGGNVVENGIQRNIRVIGEIDSPEELANVVVTNDRGIVRLSDIAEINFKEVDKTTYARNYSHPVVMINVMKKSGKNLLDATDQVNEIVAKAREEYFPPNLHVEVTGDSSDRIRNQVSELENSIIFGVLLVVGVLMFFLGLRNALFVGIAIPLSMLLSFVLLPRLGPMITGTNISLNTMTLFALVMGLGMLVDNGIVVVENVYRKLSEGLSNDEAAKQGVGEIAWPIIASTATTLAVFFPLGLWPGMMGKFMIYFPVTLSMVLASSLFVALVINAMLTAQFMSLTEEKMSVSRLIILSSAFIAMGILFTAFAQTGDSLVSRNAHASFFRFLAMITMVAGVVMSFIGWAWRSRTPLLRYGIALFFLGVFFIIASFLSANNERLQLFGSLFIVIGIMLWVFKYILTPLIHWFQNKGLPALERGYSWLLRHSLAGRYPSIFLIFLMIFLLIASFMVMGRANLKVLFFPENIPNQAIVYIEYPEGTDIEKTNALTKILEERVIEVVDRYKVNSSDDKYGHWAELHGEGYNRMVESVVSQVGQGANNPNEGSSQTELPNKGKITVQFREFRYRDGTNTQEIVDNIRSAVRGIPGALITVEKDENGPPAGPPVNLELRGDDYEELYQLAKDLREEIKSENIMGIEELKIDVNTNKPELQIYVDRQKAGQLGVSTSTIGQALRQSIYGWEVSTYKPANDDDDYKIMVRLNDESRYDVNALLNQKISFRNNQGQLLKVPISSVVTTKRTATFNKIKRINSKRVVTLYTNVLEGYNPTEIINQITALIQSRDMPEAVEYGFTGEAQEMQENLSFLLQAFIFGLAILLLIVVGQFNSISKPLIIFFAIVLSLIGVLFGMVILKMDFIIIMTMLGIISLAGIVVNNAIVLIDYTQLMIDRRKAELGLELDDLLSRQEYRELIEVGGTARLRPVLLTAITTILGLLPLTFGLNINFISLLSRFDPQIFIGGDNTMFWQPMTLVIISGLSFATFLTLIIVPVLFFIRIRFKIRFSNPEDES